MSSCYTSKTCVLYFSEGLREELKGHGVKVSVLCPGPTRVAFFREARMRLGRPDRDKLMTTPEEVALLALRGLDKSHALVVSSWHSRLLTLNPHPTPHWLVRRLAVRINVSTVPSIPRG